MIIKIMLGYRTFLHLDEPDDVMEMFESANLSSGRYVSFKYYYDL